MRFEFGQHMSAKFYPDMLRFAAVIPENPIWSDYKLWCLHAMHDSVQWHIRHLREHAHMNSTTWSQTSYAVKTKIPTDHSSAKNTTVNV